MMRRSFFERPAHIVARELLGMLLVHETAQGKTAGKIVETEAYSMDDPASHSFGGRTARNEAMFGRAGTAYVYFTYGMHHCFNVVTGKEGEGEAVLVRALEPVAGLALMRERRRMNDDALLCAGPARLVQAMGILRSHSGSDLLRGPLRIERGEMPKKIIQTTRIGITKAKAHKLRFYIAHNAFVSRK